MHARSNLGQVAGSFPDFGATGERWHNGTRLVLVADVAQRLADLRAMAPWDAARELLEHFAGRPDRLQFYGAPEGAEGQPVPEGHVWRKAVAARAAFRDPFADVRPGRRVASPIVPERRALAELRGVAGLFELLKAADPKNGGLHKALRLSLPGFAGPLALAFEDAEAVLALLAHSPPSEHIATAVVAVSKPRKVGAPVALPPLEVLQRERLELEAAHHKAPTQALAKKYGCSKDTIERRLNPDRGKGPVKARPAQPFDALVKRRA